MSLSSYMPAYHEFESIRAAVIRILNTLFKYYACRTRRAGRRARDARPRHGARGVRERDTDPMCAARGTRDTPRSTPQEVSGSRKSFIYTPPSPDPAFGPSLDHSHPPRLRAIFMPENPLQHHPGTGRLRTGQQFLLLRQLSILFYIIFF